MKPIRYFLALCWAILLATPQIHSQTEGAWTPLPPMPNAAGFMGGVPYRGKIYLFGGAPGITSSTNKAWVFDPADSSWTPLPNIPASTCGAGVVEVNGKVYVIGGGDAPFGTYYKTVRVFDIEAGTWSMGADMPYARALFACSVLHDKIYVMGGGDQSNTVLKSVLVYDPDTEHWSNGEDLPDARAFISSAVLNDKIYVLGGLNGATGSGLSHVAVFDTTNRWTVGVPLPTARWGLGACALDWRIFAFGGSSWDTPEPEFSVAEMFNPYEEKWASLASMPTPRRMLTAVPLNNKIYTFGGIKGFSGIGDASAAVEVYEPDAALLKTITPAPDLPRQLFNSPNPFAGTTDLHIFLPTGGWTELAVYDTRGELVHTLVRDQLPAGEYAVPFSATGVPAGVYFARLSVDHTVRAVIKMVNGQ